MLFSHSYHLCRLQLADITQCFLLMKQREVLEVIKIFCQAGMGFLLQPKASLPCGQPSRQKLAHTEGQLIGGTFNSQGLLHTVGSAEGRLLLFAQCATFQPHKSQWFINHTPKPPYREARGITIISGHVPAMQVCSRRVWRACAPWEKGRGTSSTEIKCLKATGALEAAVSEF